MERFPDGSPRLQRVTISDGRRGWFLHDMPHGMKMIYWGITDGREQVGQIDGKDVTFETSIDVADFPPPPDATGYVPIERG